MSVVQISPVTLPLSTAQSLTDAAVAEAERVGVPNTITIMDGGGHLVQVTRMDGAALASIDASAAKARSAVYFGAPTAELAAKVQPGGVMYTAPTGQTAAVSFVAGGVPVKDAAGVVIGAIGVGGGEPDQDHAIAVAAVAGL